MLLLLGYAFRSTAQSHPVTGRVIDDAGQPLLGVSIKLSGTTTGTNTDTKGNFSIAAAPGDRLIFSFVGYKPDTIPVGTKSTMQVVLKDNVSTLNDVVVVGYGTQKKANLTGAVAQVSGWI